MNEKSISGVFIVWISHLLFDLEVFLDLAHILLKLLSFLLFALEIWPVLLDPLSDQDITYCLIDKSECPQYDIFLQWDVCLLSIFLNKSESVDSCADLLNTTQIKIKDYCHLTLEGCACKL